MPPFAPSSDVERQRHRLNTLVLVAPGQFLTLVAFYWLRFVPALRPFAFDAPAPPPWVLLICAAVVVAPVLLPRAYFKPRPIRTRRILSGARLAVCVELLQMALHQPVPSTAGFRPTASS